MACLIIFEDIENADTVFETFDLTANRILIGSDSDNHLILDTPEVDPMHASLELRNNHWILQDLGGPGGTSVNGQLIEGPYLLRHDDLIELSMIKMRFQHNDRGVTTEFPQDMPVETVGEKPMSGRVWFAGMAGFTLTVFFIIIFLLIVAHILGLIEITNLLPMSGQ